MRSPLLLRFSLPLVLASLVASCHDEGELRVETLIETPAVTQGERVTFSVSGYPPDDDPLKAIIIEVTGAIGAYDSNPVRENGSVSVRRSYVIPVGNPNGTGTIVSRARTRGGKVDSQTSTFRVQDTVPPQFVFNSYPATLHPGDTLHTFFYAVDNVRVHYVFFRLSGGYTRRDSLFSGGPSLTREWPFPIPDTVSSGSSIVVSAFALDYVGNTVDSVLTTIPLVIP